MEARGMMRGPRMEGGRHGGHGPDWHGGRGEGSPGPDPRGRPGRWWRGRGGPEGGPPFGGWRFGRGPRVGRGDVRAAVLTLLAERSLHGYQIIQEISERSGGVWRPSPGSVYPALQLLEDEGLVRAEQVDTRRVFHLTDSGRAYVTERQEELAAVWGAVTDTVDDGLRALRDLYDQVGAAVRQVAQAGTTAEIAAARQLLTTTRRQLYRILADADTAASGQEPGDANRA